MNIIQRSIVQAIFYDAQMNNVTVQFLFNGEMIVRQDNIIAGIILSPVYTNVQNTMTQIRNIIDAYNSNNIPIFI